MDECKIGGNTEGFEFGELKAAMQDDLYWVRFFARPCCPAPDLEGAVDMLNRLAAEVDQHADLTPDEKRELCDLIEARKDWYPKSGLCRTTRNQ